MNRKSEQICKDDWEPGKIVCEFDHLPNAVELQNAFINEKDPRSIAYVRYIRRPRINWLKVVISAIIPVVVAFLFTIIANAMNLTRGPIIVVLLSFVILYFGLLAKKIAITLVKIYQLLAPENVRKRCRFEPSCSEYMLLSIQKYGTLKGICRGIRRLKRCNINGGGYDYP